MMNKAHLDGSSVLYQQLHIERF